ncbi:hypothetical protein PilKf_01859 [Pillotina sp. SPG140]
MYTISFYRLYTNIYPPPPPPFALAPHSSFNHTLTYIHLMLFCYAEQHYAIDSHLMLLQNKRQLVHELPEKTGRLCSDIKEFIMKKSIAALLMVVVGVTACVQNARDFASRVENGKLILIRYRGNGGDVDIPARLQGRPVTAIADEAFQNKNLTRISIPKTVTAIGRLAFAQNRLTSVTIPNSVTTIGWHAFKENQLTSITIPNSVTFIEGYAFEGNQLTSITIPNSVTSIGEYTFYNNQLTSVSIPNSVTSIGDYAFAENQLTSVTIGANVEVYRLAFNNGLANYYNRTGKKAGTYTYDGNGWNYRER